MQSIKDSILDDHNLELSQMEIGDDECTVIANTLQDFKTLDTLNLRENKIGDVGVTTLASSGALANLKHLWLSSNQIGVAGATAIAERELPNLKTLHLHNNRIGDTGVIALALAVSQGNLLNLEVLDLRANHIGDAGVKALADLVGKLKELYLDYNNITDDGAKALVYENVRYPKLVYLSLPGNKIKDKEYLKKNSAWMTELKTLDL